MPKVSVIMPVYNGELYIEKAIDSLLSQTFQDWELIVVDDGSTDATQIILQRYVDPRIRVIRQRNGGEACARNTGLDNLKGEYLAFLDADDLYLPNALEDLSSFLDANPRYGVVFSDGYIFDQSDNQLMQLTDVRPGIHTGFILDPLVMSPSVITVPVCTMSRLSNIRKYDLRFDETNNLIGTDWDFWIQLAVHVEFGYLDTLTCRYRIHTSNLTRTTGSDKRRKDQIYRRMKILNSKWFCKLSLKTQHLFFLDLLTIALSGDIDQQQAILDSQQFGALPASSRADLFRRVAIDVLMKTHNSELARSLVKASRCLTPGDWKTGSLLWLLHFGGTFAFTVVKLWRSIRLAHKKLTLMRNSRSEQLQKLLGVG